MTEPSQGPEPQKPATAARRATPGTGARRRRIRGLPTVLASLACFLVVFEFLAFQLASGRDPAIGAASDKPTLHAARPVVIHRRIVVRRVVHSAPTGSAVTVGGGTTGPSSSSTSAPTTTPAPATTAAAPAPAPAPVTSSS
jgi:hypothetical protein